MRQGSESMIRLMRTTLYVATAAAAAAAAADFEAQAPASAAGNLGLLLIMVRLFVLTPAVVARARSGDSNWMRAEFSWAQQTYPWANPVGRAGWVLLFVSVLLQVATGAA